MYCFAGTAKAEIIKQLIGYNIYVLHLASLVGHQLYTAAKDRVEISFLWAFELVLDLSKYQKQALTSK